MTRAYSDLAFTPAVRDMQTRMGNREVLAPLDDTDDRRDAPSKREAEFVHARDVQLRVTRRERAPLDL